MKKNKKYIIGCILFILIICLFLFLIINRKTSSIDNISNSDDTAVSQNTNSDISTVNSSNKTEIKLEDGKNVSITNGGDYTITGTLTNGQIVVNTSESVNIELNNVDITNSTGPAIQIDNAKKVTLTLKSGTTNTLKDGGSNKINAALFSNDTLVIEGEGSLNIAGNNEHGIESDDDVIINSGNITISAKNDGIHANDNITINNGNLTITNSEEGIESKNEDIVINGGTISVTSNDDALNAAKDISINAGKVYAKGAKGDGIDSNGTININGGIIVAVGGSNPECGIDTNGVSPTIKGGTLIAVGGGNSTPSTTSASQNTVRMGLNNSSGTICLKENDQVIFTLTSSQSYSTILYSSANLKTNTSYTLYNNGTASGGDIFNGYSENASYSGGTKAATFTQNSIVTIQGGSGGPEGGGNRR